MQESQEALLEECSARLAASEAKQAFKYLVEHGSRLQGFKCSLRRQGYLLTYRYETSQAWPYGFIVNRSSLLFYFRKAGLSNPAASLEALHSFQTVRRNARGELQVRVSTEPEAKSLMKQVFGNV